MITIKNFRSVQGTIETITIPSAKQQTIDAQGKLTLIPALIDPHVHFRVPGADHKEDWKTGARAAIAGGVTTVFDMPNNTPPCFNKENLLAKKRLIDQQLAEVKIPLRYHLYFGADKNNLNEIGKVKNEIIGIKVFMGSSTGNLLMDDDAALERAFQLGAQENLIVAVHAEDEVIIQKNKQKFAGQLDPAIHSKIRDRKAAIKATKKALELAEKYSAQVFILHVSTKEEIDLIRDAKRNAILAYCEVSPNHLFLNEKDYAKWGNRVQVNPPLRTEKDQEALWEAIHDRTVDMIGSDHAPHTIAEKNKHYGESPSGIPGVETTLPLLLNAYHEKKITIERIIELTRENIETIFRLDPISDVVLVDLESVKTIEDKFLQTKCGWSPYAGRKLKGWPVYTILQGEIFNIEPHTHAYATL